MDAVLLEILELKKLIIEQGLLQKEVLNFNEATQYLELSHSHLYKQTSSGEIPFYKPNGKKLYFKRSELEIWMLRNRNTTTDELTQEITNSLIKKGKKSSWRHWNYSKH
jgi:excisionase family DNA binding protein